MKNIDWQLFAIVLAINFGVILPLLVLFVFPPLGMSLNPGYFVGSFIGAAWVSRRKGDPE